MNLLKKFFNFILLVLAPIWEYFLSHLYFFNCHSRRLIIVRLDRIGDYLLWRNFLAGIKQSDRFKGYHITLIGNLVYKEFAETLDCQYVDKFIWIDLFRFNHPQWKGYKFRKLIEINKLSYDVLLHPTFSRTPESDAVIRLINSKTKIGQFGDRVNFKSGDKESHDNDYDIVIPPDKINCFEFERNRYFFQCATGDNFDALVPNIKQDEGIKKSELILIFFGAGSQDRKWNFSKYYELSEFLTQKFNMQVGFAGDNSDKSQFHLLSKGNNQKIIDYTGLSVSNLIEILKRSKLVISNDTSGFHLAMSMNIPTVCISNGNHFGRFLPYPAEYHKIAKYVFPPDFNNLGLSNFDLMLKFREGSEINIQSIEVETVFKEVITML
ncbi:MAG: glycosyltransferase family 9 protein [Bacteroidales bacterium]